MRKILSLILIAALLWPGPLEKTWRGRQDIAKEAFMFIRPSKEPASHFVLRPLPLGEKGSEVNKKEQELANLIRERERLFLKLMQKDLLYLAVSLFAISGVNNDYRIAPITFYVWIAAVITSSLLFIRDLLKFNRMAPKIAKKAAQLQELRAKVSIIQPADAFYSFLEVYMREKKEELEREGFGSIVRSKILYTEGRKPCGISITISPGFVINGRRDDYRYAYFEVKVVAERINGKEQERVFVQRGLDIGLADPSFVSEERVGAYFSKGELDDFFKKFLRGLKMIGKRWAEVTPRQGPCEFPNQKAGAFALEAI